MAKQVIDKPLVIVRTRITKEQREAVAEIAFDHGVPASDILGLAVKEFLASRKRDNRLTATTQQELTIKQAGEKDKQLLKLLAQAENFNSEVLKYVNESRESQGR